jgi:transcriptional regulator with XRE-family HTH domain
MQQLDKAAMGQRIRQIRLREGLRQWELARLLGTTQSAVHKYEHGVVPEPRRLVELSRIGGTSIEWVLTGRHWDNGSHEQSRLPADILQTACLLKEIGENERAGLDEALRISREAIKALEEPNGRTSLDPVSIAAALEGHSHETLRLLETAWKIQKAVLFRLAQDAGRRLDSSFQSTESVATPAEEN